MPEIEQIEISTNETATITTQATPSLALEVTLDNVSKVGNIPPVELVEVTVLGTLTVPDGPVVYDYGDAHGIKVLNTGDPIPPDLPAGVIVFFR